MVNFNNCLNTIFSNEIISITLLLILLYATYTDVKYLKIYNKFNISIIGIRLIFSLLPVYGLKFTTQNLIASFLAFMIFLILAMIFMHKMGGDIKFIGAFMLFFNFEYMLVFVLISSILNMVYALLIKAYLRLKKEKLKKEKLNTIKDFEDNSDKGNVILYNLIRVFLVKLPTDSELINMNDKDFNKYKLPFAPFFLMSYIITYILYLVNIL